MGEILNLWLVPQLGDRASESGPSLSIIVPARNEEGSVEAAVRRFLSQTYQDVEVVVVDDRSTDRTRGILRRLERESPNLAVVDGREPPAGWLGKPWAVQQGIEASSGDLLLLCDADVIYEPTVVASLVARLETDEAGAVSLLPAFEVEGFWEATLMPMLPFAFLTILPAWLANRTRIPLLGVGGGPGTLVSREAWKCVGGHEALRQAVVDDISLVRRIRAAGYRTTAVRARDLVSIRMYRGLREIVEGFTKNAYFALGGSLFRVLFVLTAAFVVHIGPYLLALSGLVSWSIGSQVSAVEAAGIGTVVVITMVRVILFLDLGYHLGHAIFGHPIMMAGWIVIGLRSTWRVGIRRRLEWRGRRYDSKGTTFGD